MTDRLDDAIDSVTARLSDVDDDPLMAERIVVALPERNSGWLWWPRLAITAGLAGLVALIVLRSFDGGSTGVLRTENAIAPVVELASPIARRTIVEPSSNARRTSVEPSLNVRRANVDHEFSLPSIAAVESLSLPSLAPEALPVGDALVVAPLAIAELTEDDPFFPRR